jgi:DNA-binding transcriptional MerR regulator
LSIRDAALATGLTPKALRRRIERGTLRSVMVDGRRRIAMEELLERGLLVPLDADGRPRVARPVQQRPGAAANALAERLRMLERRVAALEDQLGRLGGVP